MNDLELAGFVKKAYHTVNLVKWNNENLVLDKGYNLRNVIFGQDMDGVRPFGIVIESPQSLVVAFRGTEAWSEWYQDAEIVLKPYNGAKGRVHGGFYDLYNSLIDQNESQDWKKDLQYAYITGHSLGGSLATLLALELKNYNLVTFGSPKVGDREWADGAKETLSDSKRYHAKYDPVPLLPLSTWHVSFEHVCEATSIYDHKSKVFTPVENHSLDRYIELVGNTIS